MKSAEGVGQEVSVENRYRDGLMLGGVVNQWRSIKVMVPYACSTAQEIGEGGACRGQFTMPLPADSAKPAHAPEHRGIDAAHKQGPLGYCLKMGVTILARCRRLSIDNPTRGRLDGRLFFRGDETCEAALTPFPLESLASRN